MSNMSVSKGSTIGASKQKIAMKKGAKLRFGKVQMAAPIEIPFEFEKRVDDLITHQAKFESDTATQLEQMKSMLAAFSASVWLQQKRINGGSIQAHSEQSETGVNQKIVEESNNSSSVSSSSSGSSSSLVSINSVPGKGQTKSMKEEESEIGLSSSNRSEQNATNKKGVKVPAAKTAKARKETVSKERGGKTSKSMPATA